MQEWAEYGDESSLKIHLEHRGQGTGCIRCMVQLLHYNRARTHAHRRDITNNCHIYNITESTCVKSEESRNKFI